MGQHELEHEVRHDMTVWAEWPTGIDARVGKEDRKVPVRAQSVRRVLVRVRGKGRGVVLNVELHGGEDDDENEDEDDNGALLLTARVMASEVMREGLLLLMQWPG